MGDPWPDRGWCAPGGENLARPGAVRPVFPRAWGMWVIADGADALTAIGANRVGLTKQRGEAGNDRNARRPGLRTVECFCRRLRGRDAHLSAHSVCMGNRVRATRRWSSLQTATRNLPPQKADRCGDPRERRDAGGGAIYSRVGCRRCGMREHRDDARAGGSYGRVDTRLSTESVDNPSRRSGRESAIGLIKSDPAHRKASSSTTQCVGEDRFRSAVVPYPCPLRGMASRRPAFVHEERLCLL